MIRRMRAADLAEVTRLDAAIFGPSAWTRAEFEQEMTGPDRTYLVWQGVDPAVGQDSPGEGRPVVLGYAGVWTGGPSAHLLTLAVSPVARGTGIGTSLVAATAQEARLAGCQQMRLEVRVDNLPAIRLYTRLGFVRVGYEPHYYQPEDVDAYILAHPLAPAVDAQRRGRGPEIR